MDLMDMFGGDSDDESDEAKQPDPSAPQDAAPDMKAVTVGRGCDDEKDHPPAKEGKCLDVTAPAATLPWCDQSRRWPSSGKVILAHFDETSVVVYQAYNARIAAWAVEHQCFGGPDWSPTRMTWIKTNFLWMMYRCGWATKVRRRHGGKRRAYAICVQCSGLFGVRGGAGRSVWGSL